MGERAWLLETDDAAGARALAEAVRGALRAAGLGARVRPGARTVLVELPGATAADQARVVLETLAGPAEESREHRGAEVTIEVVYAGDDLDSVADELGLSPEGVITHHLRTTWTADFCGFAPGFAYLSGWRHRVARRAEPRTRVPAGAVGLADGFSAVYPSASPGGWRLIGHTAARLWDPERPVPALVAPGDVVHFRAVREHVPTASAVPTVASPGGTGLLVIDPGALTLVQDLGRAGHEHLGVPPSGAADAASARRANRLVGNPRDAAVLETLGGLALEAVGDQVVAVVGAEVRVQLPDPVTDATAGTDKPHADDDGPPHVRPFHLPDGAVLQVAAPHGALRAYLAVRGGVAVPTVLGSRATDALSGLGPAPVARGALLPVGPAVGVVGGPEAPPRAPQGPLRVVLGPRDDWFTDEAVATFLASEWQVSQESNRVGLRLTGPELERARSAELPSEPMVAGAVQVPPSGRPVVLLRDHPVTGGYPVIAVVVADDLDRLGQLAAGAQVRFTVRG